MINFKIYIIYSYKITINVKMDLLIFSKEKYFIENLKSNCNITVDMHRQMKEFLNYFSSLFYINVLYVNLFSQYPLRIFFLLQESTCL